MCDVEIRTKFTLRSFVYKNIYIAMLIRIFSREIMTYSFVEPLISFDAVTVSFFLSDLRYILFVLLYR